MQLSLVKQPKTMRIRVRGIPSLRASRIVRSIQCKVMYQLENNERNFVMIS